MKYNLEAKYKIKDTFLKRVDPVSEVKLVYLDILNKSQKADNESVIKVNVLKNILESALIGEEADLNLRDVFSIALRNNKETNEIKKLELARLYVKIESQNEIELSETQEEILKKLVSSLPEEKLNPVANFKTILVLNSQKDLTEEFI